MAPKVQKDQKVPEHRKVPKGLKFESTQCTKVSNEEKSPKIPKIPKSLKVLLVQEFSSKVKIVSKTV